MGKGINMNNTIEQLQAKQKELSDKMDELYKEKTSIDCELAAFNSKNLLEELKNNKDIIFTFKADRDIPYIQYTEKFYQMLVVIGSNGFYHFEVPLTANYTVRVNDNDIDLSYSDKGCSELLRLSSDERLVINIKFLLSIGIEANRLIFSDYERVIQYNKGEIAKLSETLNLIKNIMYHE